MRVVLIVIGVVFASFFLMNRCSQHADPTNAAQSDPIAQRQQVLDQVVLLEPLKQYAPKDYEAMQQAANSEADPDKIVATLRSPLWWKLREIIEKRADDQGQKLWANAYLQQLYNAKYHGNCFPISFPLYSRTSVEENRALLHPSTQQKSAEALTYILTHLDGARSTLDSSYPPEGWSTVSERLRSEYGDDAGLINAGETAEDKKKQCDVVISTFEYMLALPDEQQGRVIRWMLNTHISVAVF